MSEVMPMDFAISMTLSTPTDSSRRMKAVFDDTPKALLMVRVP